MPCAEGMKSTKNRRIAEVLTLEIAQGQWPVSGLLPSEMQLVARFGVSRQTIRSASLGLHHGLRVETGSERPSEVCAVGLPIRFNGERSFNGQFSGLIGQDSRSVLLNAGLRQEDIDALTARGAVQTGS